MQLILNTNRLVLRPLELSDLEWCTEMLTDRDVVRYVYGDDVASEVKIRTEMPLAVRRCAGGWIGIWAILDRDTGSPQGTALLLFSPNERDDTDWDLIRGEHLPPADIEIGFMLRKAAMSKGVATEAASRLLPSRRHPFGKLWR